MTPELVFLVLATPVAVWVAWSDMARMTIPNAAVGALVAIYALAGVMLLPMEEYLWRWVHLGVMLAVGIVAWMARLVGAGDAKFAAAMAPFVALSDLSFVFYLFAAVLLAAFATHRLAARIGAVRALVPNWRSWEEKKDFPMGLALAGTLVLYLAMKAASAA
ncbi:MAG: hypothetical protein D6811_11875 [Alphaproteobacteria bacterium]|nr:MAG: hypothetical protein D6811_11875 [Alphaproteobacteria bacterium]